MSNTKQEIIFMRSAPSHSFFIKCAALIAGLAMEVACKPSNTTKSSTVPPVEYVLLQDVYVVQVPKAAANLYPLLPDTHGETATEKIVTPTIEQYRADPTAWKFVRGVMAAGTTIRATRYEEYQTITYTYRDCFAEVLDGPFKGMEVEIQGISQLPGGKYLKQATASAPTTQSQ